MTAANCPICDRPSSAEFRPFCSSRCADVDLHRWLSGRYSVPAAEDPENLDEDRSDD
ncbi:MAG: DNA gyrase inhibitor YacG [Phenylobacterium sp.]